MNVFFIRNKEEADKDFDEVAPLFEKCVRHAVHGEYDVPALRRMVENGRIVIIGLREEDKPAHFAFAVEFILYPTGKTVANVMALGGARLMDAYREIFPGFVRYLKAAGASQIECSVSPAMARMHLRFSKNWKETYRVLRYDI